MIFSATRDNSVEFDPTVKSIVSMVIVYSPKKSHTFQIVPILFFCCGKMFKFGSFWELKFLFADLKLILNNFWSAQQNVKSLQLNICYMELFQTHFLFNLTFTLCLKWSNYSIEYFYYVFSIKYLRHCYNDVFIVSHSHTNFCWNICFSPPPRPTPLLSPGSPFLL